MKKKSKKPVVTKRKPASGEQLKTAWILEGSTPYEVGPVYFSGDRAFATHKRRLLQLRRDQVFTTLPAAVKGLNPKTVYVVGRNFSDKCSMVKGSQIGEGVPLDSKGERCYGDVFTSYQKARQAVSKNIHNQLTSKRLEVRRLEQALLRLKRGLDR